MYQLTAPAVLRRALVLSPCWRFATCTLPAAQCCTSPFISPHVYISAVEDGGLKLDGLKKKKKKPKQSDQDLVRPLSGLAAAG